MTNDTTTRLLYDRKDAARQLSISISSLERLIARKCLRVRRIGGRILVPHAELQRFARPPIYTAGLRMSEGYNLLTPLPHRETLKSFW